MNKTAAIMQPYLFPYIGYFCLAAASDVFVFYDDVQFIKKGWINRNRILINQEAFTFTLPVSKAQADSLIMDVQIHDLPAFRDKFIKQLQRAYAHAPYYKTGMDYVQRVFDGNPESLSTLAMRSVTGFFDLLGMEKDFRLSSADFAVTRGADKTDRLIAITKALGCACYVNPPGGVELYNKEDFAQQGVDLSFIKPAFLPYKQGEQGDFIEGLSIIDLIMHNDLPALKTHLQSYQRL